MARPEIGNETPQRLAFQSTRALTIDITSAEARTANGERAIRGTTSGVGSRALCQLPSGFSHCEPTHATQPPLERIWIPLIDRGRPSGC